MLHAATARAGGEGPWRSVGSNQVQFCPQARPGLDAAQRKGAYEQRKPTIPLDFWRHRTSSYMHESRQL